MLYSSYTYLFLLGCLRGFLHSRQRYREHTIRDVYPLFNFPFPSFIAPEIFLSKPGLVPEP